MALNAGFQYLEQRDGEDNIVKAGVTSKKHPFANKDNTGIYDVIAEDLRWLYERGTEHGSTYPANPYIGQLFYDNADEHVWCYTPDGWKRMAWTDDSPTSVKNGKMVVRYKKEET